MKVLTYEKLQYLVEKIKSGFVQQESGKTLSSNDYTTLEKEKLGGIENGANNYVHPSTHDPSIIEETEMKRFVSDAQIESWNNKVSKDGTKVLSTNDYTTLDKDKLADIEKSAQVNKIESIKSNGTTLPISSKSVNITVPIKLSELTNDKGFQTKSEVQALISQLNNITKKIVQSLPYVGEDNVFYLVPKAGSDNNIYDEFMYIDGKFEKIGDTATTIDLSGYVKNEQLKDYIKSVNFTEISQGEIDALFQ